MLKLYKPITPGLRHRIDVKDPDLWKGKPVKKLSKGLNKSGGRNHHGRITTRRRGGGHKRLYRIIDTQRIFGIYGEILVLRLEYDPNRSGNIALCKTNGGKLFYILAPNGLKAGDKIKGRLSLSQKGSDGLKYNIGESYKLSEIPIGTNIYNIEITPGNGGQISRSAGTTCILIENLENGESIIQVPSGKKIKISSNCLASIGQVSNISYNKRVLGKAGRKRWIGRRPIVRGEAMNPIDHPHGGKSHGPGGLNTQPRTKWGKLAKWRKTAK